MVKKVRMNWWEFTRLTKYVATSPEVWEELLPLTKKVLEYVIERIKEEGQYVTVDDVREWINEAATT